MACSPVRRDNPRALASGLSYVQVDKHGIIFQTTYISVDLAHYDIFCVEVGTGGMRRSQFEGKLYAQVFFFLWHSLTLKEANWQMSNATLSE